MPSKRQTREEAAIKVYLPKWLHKAFKQYAVAIDVPMNRIILDFIWGLLVPDFVTPPEEKTLKHLVAKNRQELEGLGLDFMAIASGYKPSEKHLRIIQEQLDIDLDDFDALVRRSYPGGRHDLS